MIQPAADTVGKYRQFTSPAKPYLIPSVARQLRQSRRKQLPDRTRQFLRIGLTQALITQ